MTSPGQGSVSYLCPRCHAALTAQAEDAGQRQECPHCGKTVKVPGTLRSAGKSPSPKPAPADPRPPAPVQQGIANVAVLCPVCGTRMYATREQVGQTMVCPDCLETVAIPPMAATGQASSPGKPQRPSRSMPPGEATPGKATPGKATPGQPTSSSSAPGDDADDEMKLSDPVDIPADRYLPKSLTGMLEDATGPSASQPGSEPPTSPSAPPEDGVFAVKCPTCDTLVYATEDEIGQQRTCPDCLSIVTITRPRPKPRRVNEVVDADYEGPSFTLSEPAPLDLYHRTELGLDPKTLGEAALRKAEQAYDERKQQESVLPAIPLWDGLFRFLPHLPMVMRIVFSAALLGGTTKLALASIVWASAGGIGQIAALFATIVVVALTAIGCSFMGCTCLHILQESANGHDNITDWPDLTPMEWPLDALPAMIAVFWAILPGVVLFLVTGAMGMPVSTRWIFLLISLYLFLPIVQLSMLEADSLTVPASQPILTSLNKDFLLWAMLYLMTFAIALVVALTIAPVRADTATGVVMLLAVVWALAMFLYYRVLGRLAWACQVRLLEKPDAEPEKDKR